MLFINPIELLDLQDKTLENLDDETLRKARKRLLAEIDLNDDGLYQLKGRALTKSNCAQAIDELEDGRKKAFYHHLARQNRALNDYLSLGDETFFATFELDPIFQNADFVHFVSPYFAYNFERSLSKALRSGDQNSCLSILKTTLLIDADFASTAYKSTVQELEDRIAEIDSLKLDIKAKKWSYTPAKAQEIVLTVKRHFPVAVLNSLPRFFEGELEKVAAAINYLQLAIWDTFDIVDVPFQLLEHLLELNIDSADKKTYQDNYALAKRTHDDRVAHAQNAPLLQPWSTLLAELKDMEPRMQQKKYTPKDALLRIETALDTQALNDLPSFANSIRNEIASAVRSLSLHAWNEQNDILSSLALIRIALKIITTEEFKKRLLQDETELIALEQKFRGIYSCYFCDKSATSEGSKLKKTIYKEVSRTYIPRKVQFQYIEMEIPRCADCEKVHNAGKTRFWLFSAAGLFVGFLLGVMLENFIIGIGVGVGLGLLVGYYTEKNYAEQHHVKLANNASLKQHPLLVEKVAQGWGFNKPTA